ncbi:hypothetical protein Y023_5862 [Burkholderia pseudomallei A79D]|nr:hypothetical protein Y023_5862 [Burkholderia pseudomallei A79D]KGX94775.1 hypothetical protein X997_5712 [Burkholderia pseudomallei A79C]
MREPPESVRLTHRASSDRGRPYWRYAGSSTAAPRSAVDRIRTRAPCIGPVRLPFSNVSERAHTRLT